MRIWPLALGAVLAASTAAALGPFHDVPSGPRALPGDTLPPFGMKDADGHVPPPPPLPPGAVMPGPGGPPESTAPGPNPDQATALARAAIADCARAGYRVGAAVVNSAGEAVVLLNATGTDGSHGFVGMRKALVALTFARPSSQVPALTGDPAVTARITPAMFVEGGAVPILRNGRVIGAIGVSGAAGTPIGHRDEVCAQAALRR
jgi:glc operon protein GlcG